MRKSVCVSEYYRFSIVIYMYGCVRVLQETGHHSMCMLDVCNCVHL
jgi:hypothetical protein